jgi:hypothetical protein
LLVRRPGRWRANAVGIYLPRRECFLLGHQIGPQAAKNASDFGRITQS